MNSTGDDSPQNRIDQYKTPIQETKEVLSQAAPGLYLRQVAAPLGSAEPYSPALLCRTGCRSRPKDASRQRR